MTETVYDWLPVFAEYAEFSDDFEVGDFVELREDAPKTAKSAYHKYIKFISHALIGWDDLIIENRKIVGMSSNIKGKSKKQCEIVMKLISDGWIDNNPFIKD